MRLPFGKKYRRRKLLPDIMFDEVLVDSALSSIEGETKEAAVLEKPFSRISFIIFFVAILALFVVLFSRVFYLTSFKGEAYAYRAAANSIQRTVVVPPRGIIYDRKGKIIVENRWIPEVERIERFIRDPFAFSHVIGFVGRPNADDVKANPELYNFSEIGRDGIEYFYDDLLRGQLGEQLQEVDAVGDIVSEGLVRDPVPGNNIALSLDAEFQKFAYQTLFSVYEERGYKGGALVAFDVNTGEVLALISIPSFDANLFSKGIPKEDFEKLLINPLSPLFNRAIAGRYPPGSSIKPYVGLAALSEGIVDETKQIYSAGYISIPDPYRPEASTIFKDNKVHGWVDMRHALAVSSNVYFYTVGGGYEDVRGLGIKKIQEWLRHFGFDEQTGIDLPGEEVGIVPGPEEKPILHPNNPVWRIGDTYHTSIGQGDVTVTPMEAARALAGLANGTHLPAMHLLLDVEDVRGRQIRSEAWQQQTFPPELFSNISLNVIHEGMRLASLEGTARGLGGNAIRISSKTGTAQVGGVNRNHSWYIGFAPSEAPRLGIVVFLESGPEGNQIGGVFVALQLLNWISEHGGVEELFSRS